MAATEHLEQSYTNQAQFQLNLPPGLDATELLPAFEQLKDSEQAFVLMSLEAFLKPDNTYGAEHYVGATMGIFAGLVSKVFADQQLAEFWQPMVDWRDSRKEEVSQGNEASFQKIDWQRRDYVAEFSLNFTGLIGQNLETVTKHSERLANDFSNLQKWQQAKILFELIRLYKNRVSEGEQLTETCLTLALQADNAFIQLLLRVIPDQNERVQLLTELLPVIEKRSYQLGSRDKQ